VLLGVGEEVEKTMGLRAEIADTAVGRQGAYVEEDT
jgi:hypothetical protein